MSRVESLIAIVTFGLTLATAPRMYWGVLAGLLMNLCHFLYQRLHPRIIEVGLHPDGSLRDRHLWAALEPLAPHVLALRMDAELDFASASALEQRVAQDLARTRRQAPVLLAQPINRIDVTGLEVFAQLHALMLARGGCLHVSGLKLPVETALRKAGVLPAAAGLVTYHYGRRSTLWPCSNCRVAANPVTRAPDCVTQGVDPLLHSNLEATFFVSDSAAPHLVDLRDLRLDTAHALVSQVKAAASHL